MVQTANIPQQQKTANPPDVSDTQIPPYQALIPSNKDEKRQVPQKYGGKKKLITILSIGILIVGTVSAVFLTQHQQLPTSRAFDCSKYIFDLSKDGVLSIQNRATIPVEGQEANVYINDAFITTISVPHLSEGDAKIIQRIAIPQSLTGSWKIVGVSQCESSGMF